MTNKSKNILLIASFFLGLFVCYNLAIKKTIELKREHSSLKQQELLFQNTPKQLSILKQKQIHYDSILIANRLDGSSFQNNLLKTINIFSKKNDLKIVRFLEPHINKQNDLILKTYKLTIKGGYNALIDLVHKLEQQTRFGEIINLHFEKKKNLRTNSSYLEATILIKSFG